MIVHEYFVCGLCDLRGLRGLYWWLLIHIHVSVHVGLALKEVGGGYMDRYMDE